MEQVTCAINAIGATGCATTDAKCICTATSFLSGVQTCISTACSASDQAGTFPVLFSHENMFESLRFPLTSSEAS